MEQVIEKHYDQLAQFLSENRLTNWRENLFILFGTWSYVKAICFPKERVLPLRGLEWSFINQGSGGQIELSSTNKKQDDTDNLL